MLTRQPEDGARVSCADFTVATITSVGYGDISATTVGEQVLLSSAVASECLCPLLLRSFPLIFSVHLRACQAFRWTLRSNANACLLAQGLATFIMLIGAIVWGDALANFCSIVANMNPDQSIERQVCRRACAWDH